MSLKLTHRKEHLPFQDLDALQTELSVFENTLSLKRVVTKDELVTYLRGLDQMLDKNKEGKFSDCVITNLGLRAITRTINSVDIQNTLSRELKKRVYFFIQRHSRKFLDTYSCKGKASVL